MLTYVLQAVTIAITLGLGLFSAYQTKKIEHGQNIISVTTNYRMKRCEQLKECGTILLTNTNPQLLDRNENNAELLKTAVMASENISMILHRHFPADKELIDLSQEIVNLAINREKNADAAKLERKRTLFRLKCDVYTSADWNRIKSETKGVNTSSQSWIDYYKKLEEDYKEEFEELNKD